MSEIETIHDLIRAAVHSRRLITVSYDLYSRLVEPWALATDQEGHGVLIAWQIGGGIAWQVSGGAKSSAATGWKEFRLAEIAGVTVQSEAFELNADRKPPLRAYLRVDPKQRHFASRRQEAARTECTEAR